MTFPLFMQRIPFGIRHLFVCVLQATTRRFIMSSHSGVIFASLGSGLGEITYLSLTPFFGRNAISAWSSGTGGAGVIGALSYAGLTEPKLANLSPKAALLVMLVVPVIFASAIPESKAAKGDKKRKMRSYSSTVTDGTLKQRQLSLTEKLLTIIAYFYHYVHAELRPIRYDSLKKYEKKKQLQPLLKFMIPLMLVYLGEYLINQGIVLYQVGVFISRSSINLIRLPYSILVLLPILQLLNAVLFFLDALYFFIPHIGIIFTLILFEGLFGGSSYVNTFDRIHNYVAPDVREYALSVGSLGDSVGIVIAGFTKPQPAALARHPSLQIKSINESNHINQACRIQFPQSIGTL
uniref:Battenin n=2 Tax=Parascaris TaxID=6254 RepID=A0A914RQU4_PAREQ